MKDLFSNSGKYVPSFFMMKIDSEHFGNDMTDKELSLFVHEYVHFLQSFTTIKGLEKLLQPFQFQTEGDAVFRAVDKVRR